MQFLLYLVDRANKERTCFPAVSISRELHISILMIRRAMRELVQKGYVKKREPVTRGEQGNAEKLDRRVEEMMLGQRNLKESIAPESARV